MHRSHSMALSEPDKEPWPVMSRPRKPRAACLSAWLGRRAAWRHDAAGIADQRMAGAVSAGLRQIEVKYRLSGLAGLACALAGRAMSLPLFRQDDQASRACGLGVRPAESRGSIRLAPHSGRQAFARGEDAEHVPGGRDRPYAG
jgi:hypothetical protein